MKLSQSSIYHQSQTSLADFYNTLHKTLLSYELSSQSKYISDHEKFRISLYIDQYKPENIKLEVNGRQLRVSGRRISQITGGTDIYEFTRNFDVPDIVNINTLIHRITDEGVLVIEADWKVPEVRQFFNDQSDENHLNITFDIMGYDDKDVNVSLNGQDLIVSAGHRLKSDECGDSTMKQHFNQVIKLDNNVDLASLTPMFTDDGYLNITAKKDPKITLQSVKQLLIKRK